MFFFHKRGLLALKFVSRALFGLALLLAVLVLIGMGGALASGRMFLDWSRNSDALLWVIILALFGWLVHTLHQFLLRKVKLASEVYAMLMQRLHEAGEAHFVGLSNQVWISEVSDYGATKGFIRVHNPLWNSSDYASRLTHRRMLIHSVKDLMDHKSLAEVAETQIPDALFSTECSYIVGPDVIFRMAVPSDGEISYAELESLHDAVQSDVVLA